jgi:tRNA/rRNA methyltransferase
MSPEITPAIVLARTQLPENIGAAARAMMNFNLTDLRLAAPREAWPHTRAYDLAGTASPLLDRAGLHPDLQAAIADKRRVYAVTARGRDMLKPVFGPREAIRRIVEEGHPCALVFGPERTGLTNDEVTLADAIITIPTGTELPSLNLAQAVVVLAYEWFALQKNAAPSAFSTPALSTGPGASLVAERHEPATKEALFQMLAHLERALDAADFWKVEAKKPAMWRNLQNIFTRAHLSGQEVRSLHGVIAALEEGAPLRKALKSHE